MGRWLSWRLRAMAARDWAAWAARPPRLPEGEMRALRDEARGLQRGLRLFLRDTAPVARRARDQLATVRLPAGSDWRWRPQAFSAAMAPPGYAAPASGTRLGDDMAVWHDCPQRALILRQVPADAAPDVATDAATAGVMAGVMAGVTGGAPFGLSVEGFGFQGSYVSLSIDLPAEAREGLGRDHILRLDYALSAERTVQLRGRLNVVHGPNTERMQADLATLSPGRATGGHAEFDLGRTQVNAARLERIWLDLICDAPVMNRIGLLDIVLSRRPRSHV